MKKIRSVMTKSVDVIHPNAKLVQAADKMKRHNIGVLPVCDGDKLKGMITDRDIVVRAVADRKDFDRTRVSDVMSRGVYYCYDDESLDEAAEMMQDKKVRRLLVLNREKRLVGLLSLDDLAVESRTGNRIRKTLQEASGSTPRLVSIVIGSVILGLGVVLYNQREGVRERFLSRVA